MNEMEILQAEQHLENLRSNGAALDSSPFLPQAVKAAFSEAIGLLELLLKGVKNGSAA